MGVRWFFSVFLWVPFCVCIIGIVSSQRGFTACDIPGCNCTIKTASWKIVNCSLRDEQIVNFEQNNIPESAIEIYIFGGDEINFATKTFNVLPGLTLIHINGTRKIAMERKSFNNLNSSSLFIQIHNCDELIIKTGAFDYIQSSISSEIVDVNYVTIEQSAFSKLYSSTFKNVKRVALYERSFDFKNQGNIMKHGPVSVISFDNVVVPEIPPETFLKSLASVMFYNSRIGSIHTDAFKANEISAVAMINTTIGDIRERAFTERTLINDFRISKCNISKLHPRSIMGAITKFTLNHSIITHIEPRAIVATVARAEVIGNQILNFRSSGFVFKNWNRIDVDDNIIVHLGADFVVATSPSVEIERFSFKGNEVYDIDEGALSFLSVLDERVLVFDDNFFNKSCNCTMDKWVEELTNGTSRTIKLFVDTSYCKVNEYLSRCFSLPVGIINIHNFTQKTCQNFTVCEPYEGKTKIVNTTSKIFTQVDESEKRNWLIFIMVVVGIFIFAILTTFIVLLVRGSRWLKEKGYFRNNMHYNNNDLSNEEEGTIVTVDENEKLEIPEELTVEFLQMLAQRLDDPVTNQEATEMVVRLYEMFIVDDSYENNNRQDEEAHLYEELGNLNLQIPPPPYEEENEQQATNAPRSILKLMEEKFNLQNDDPSTLVSASPALANEYSEPTDAAVHLYSELKNKTEKLDKNESKDTVKSNGSAKNIFRPLPSKPTSKSFLLDEAGPSSKL